jgi:hypothetical protein
VTTVADTDRPPGGGQDIISALDWDRVCTGRHNVLLEGPDESTDDLVRLLEPHLRAPVLWRPVPAASALPAGDCGTLVLQNVGALGRVEQADLRRWLDVSGGRKQVISTTARSLFPLVERGLFDEALYYRLNVMLLCVSPGAASERLTDPRQEPRQ